MELEGTDHPARDNVLQAAQLVVRMQYDDDIKIGRCHMENSLLYIVQTLHNKSGDLRKYDVSLAARLNEDCMCDDSCNKVDGQDCTSPKTNGQPPPTPVQTQQTSSSKCNGGVCGLTALTSSPTENYNYFSKTKLNEPDHGVSTTSTILVEIFLNEKISDTDIRDDITDAVTGAINHCIIQKQGKGKNIRISVLSFLCKS